MHTVGHGARSFSRLQKETLRTRCAVGYSRANAETWIAVAAALSYSRGRSRRSADKDPTAVANRRRPAVRVGRCAPDDSSDAVEPGNSVVWWTERGLALYGNDAAREDAVEDLLKRRNRALAKLETPAQPNRRSTSHTRISTALAQGSHAPPQHTPAGITAEIEILACSRCETSFERARVRGRKPLLCPDCRSTPGEP